MKLIETGKAPAAIGPYSQGWVAAGLVFGAFTDCRNARRADYGPEALLRDFFAGWPRPVLYNVRSAHCSPMVTLPMGTACTIDGGAGTMTVRCGC